MRIKERALSLLLSLVLVLTFMPALAFAEEVDEPADVDGTPVVEEVVEEPAPEIIVDEPADEELVEPPEATETAPATKTVDEDWSLFGMDKAWFYPGYSGSVWSYVSISSDSEIQLEYRWLKGETVINDWTDITNASYDSEYNEYEIQTTVEEAGIYTLTVREKNNITEEQSVNTSAYPFPIQGGLYYYPMYDNDNAAGVEETGDIALTGNLVIPSSVAFPDGKTRTITECLVYAPHASSISIPASVTSIYSGLGYDDNGNPIPGFTIFGTTGSYAQTYASNNGFIFRDPAAEAAAAAEAARQGTPGSLPGVKASKPKAAKKAITVKWKKLKKKQLKSGVSNIEVWVCSDGAFARGATIEKVVGKKKASLKIKGLQKGVTYYVKVRAITYSGGTKIVGPWSAVKTVKVKK